MMKPGQTAKTDPKAEPASATAVRVLRIEGAAVLQMAEALPEDFDAAVDAILSTKGRVILGGIGKSGHIARKISSTLASTGTPSAFVHPAEASHGDLGMITPDDLVILISNSGETSELRDIVAHVARFSIPMIGISGKPSSTLMQAADHRLTLPDAPEACALGIGAHHLDDTHARAGRCAGGGCDGTARFSAGTVPDLPPGRKARRAIVEGRATHARHGGTAAGRCRKPDVGDARRDERKGLWPSPA